ncbi:MAG: Peptide deformylase [Candidatus Moranbacteria bacterium GW2011_GWE1_35_17]|nr:MAG: Peptide deformylase [Candidatus Moranbacteria bacterium GW2011_GWE1_35_17]KKP71965.1 MAG: Peptide deformylase [Candidatus Moranbacteria bacterium GW2011_GWE2_35_164]KKP82863.1 MAG: Peptide deformylase [Candidatus Moranbacteria bacterium GW2011_GWF2_35_54]KKP84187.1 MAG: Peptide deformylase [Candidatus Moranbacteria bacterium GW2011_GWF1_35_5]
MKILTYPNPILDKKAQNIKNPLDLEIQKLIPGMLATMRKNNGMGLAAPQIGKSIRLCVIEHQGETYVLINPKITSHSNIKLKNEEGCLSFPGKFIPVERFETVQVRYLDEKGKKCKIKAQNLLARAFQHEIDHLDGIVFINR